MQALFANQRETNLASTTALIEECLTELGYHPPETSRIDLAGALQAWRVQKGSAIAVIALYARTEFTHMRISAVVMTLDDKVDRAALYEYLLTLNVELCGNAFAVDRDRVLLVAERTTLDLDRSEIVDLIKRVTTNADHHDDQLVAKFGGTLGGPI